MPLIHGWPGSVVLDHPSALCRKLAAGELDVALVSSFEFLRNPIYKVVDGISISSDGPVYSVVVAHAGGKPPSEIELDPASQTSVALLQHLLAEQGEIFSGIEMISDPLSPLKERRGRLLIGDQAIRFRQQYAGRYGYWDLGEEWNNLTGLPFIYALWLVRPEVREAKTLGEQLRELRDQNLRDIDRIIAGQSEFDPKFCRRYYASHLRFSLGKGEKQGLRKFANACAKLDLIPGSEFDLQLV
jgi:predicted solute-binding protein